MPNPMRLIIMYFYVCMMIRSRSPLDPNKQNFIPYLTSALRTKLMEFVFPHCAPVSDRQNSCQHICFFPPYSLITVIYSVNKHTHTQWERESSLPHFILLIERTLGVICWCEALCVRIINSSINIEKFIKLKHSCANRQLHSCTLARTHEYT